MCRIDLLYDKLWLLKGKKKNLSTQEVGCPSMARGWVITETD